MPQKPKYAHVYCYACEASWKDNVKFFFFPRNYLRSHKWAEIIGKPCSLEEAKTFHSRKKALCEKHFAANQYTTSEKKRLNRNAVPLPVISTSSSLPIEQTSPCNKKMFVPEFPRVLYSPEPLEVRHPVRTYSRNQKLSLSSFPQQPKLSSEVVARPSSDSHSYLLLVDNPCKHLLSCISESCYRWENASVKRIRRGLLQDF